MSLKRDLTDEEFEVLSVTRKKRYVARLLIGRSDATSVPQPKTPIAIVMAGVPGAGKTEFLDTFSELLETRGFDSFIRIDLDEIVEIYPGYTPKTDAQFRSQGNHTVAAVVDIAKDGHYNMMIDGTFSGTSGASLQNIGRLLNVGYQVQMFFMHDNILTSWEYTKAREKTTHRGIDSEGFKRACTNLTTNLKAAMETYGSNPHFILSIVLQKELRDKDYSIVSDRAMIDEILNKGYNIDKLKES
jgi:predicted ABC-type ATPase